MPTESRKLVEARVLLGRFEAKMAHAECLPPLIDGLSILGAICEEVSSSIERQIASNIAVAYARKVATRVEQLLAQEPQIHWDTWNHWRDIFAEFDNAAFELPQDVSEVRSNLFMKGADKTLKFMSPSERQELFDRLKAASRADTL